MKENKYTFACINSNVLWCERIIRLFAVSVCVCVRVCTIHMCKEKRKKKKKNIRSMRQKKRWKIVCVRVRMRMAYTVWWCPTRSLALIVWKSNFINKASRRRWTNERTNGKNANKKKNELEGKAWKKWNKIKWICASLNHLDLGIKLVVKLLLVRSY